MKIPTLLKHGLIATLTFMVSLNSFADPGNGKGNGNGNGNPHSHQNQRGNNGFNKGHQNVNQQDGFSSQLRIDSRGGLSVSITYDDARALAIKNNLTGYKGLPPGIAKNLTRGKPLPPGIAKKAVPSIMLSQLPHYDGYEWQIVGNDLVLIAITTSIITSVINNVFD
ncbi:TPA: anti-virulence regulator CigR family protein [Proteus mirabilis]|uniref:anti-virulence regulator CigR family protein n=1 Tax=Proteus mirabilis TaxID=584 RepID=UPI000537DF84|nr:anti-virulence regulator CigR family protein [Proteus mirabilis]AUT92130.1 hypothetical protein MC46_010505 [Proteus mirabilis]AUU34919.1 hypothetical protein MC72_005895 [Proteus mirabilis]EKW0544727.1 hypothetical protein [Proteus mirabilis]EKW4849882.1 hypothetical protein [Proteus mirabilis]EKY0560117.1 hypothetical protein [Proteus mirabilis]